MIATCRSIAYGICFLTGVLFTSCEDPQKTIKELNSVAAEINEKCPQMIDSETRLDGIDVREPNTLAYRYTLVNLLAQNVDTVQFYRLLWPGIISNIKVSAEMKKLRENNTTIEYVYSDKNNKFIYAFRINPSDYK